ncbi:AAA family ATPase [Methanosarcina sp. DH2]|jgi:predicted AAA+ superfamily ATPase|uniref:ATP-binding protein n=1 Tax=Methanosarcina sp. DH2 TaxID=2605639 RepID=UPI001E47AB8F|nr:ATP-binding protein [Methanosarcina sp. DH2]MCC4771373.1 AAA family ATPase [Methanosarcina sp. DH2]
MKQLMKMWNPWWTEREVPDSRKRISRPDTLEKILKILDIREIVCITGVRRCGKSTVMYQAIDHLIGKGVAPENILYFNLDEPFEDKNVGLLDRIFDEYIELHAPKGRKYLFLDEIQNIENWEQWVKKFYDLYGEELKFVLTGSNSTMLSDRLSTLLTGRMITQHVFPLSFKEFLDFAGFEIKDTDTQRNEILHHFNNYIFKGGFPEVVLEEDNGINHMRLTEYFNSILLRDIIAGKKIRESAKLIELANYSLSNVSTLMSYSKISKVAGLSINSLKEYLLYLEQAYLIYQLHFFSYSVKDSISSQMPKKLYCIDNGLRNAAAFTFSADEGRLAENLVFLELKRRKVEFFYWKGKREVDFVVKNRDGTLNGINCTYTDRVRTGETSALLEFKEQFGEKVSELILLTKNLEKEEEGIRYVSLWKMVLGIE